MNKTQRERLDWAETNLCRTLLKLRQLEEQVNVALRAIQDVKDDDTEDTT